MKMDDKIKTIPQRILPDPPFACAVNMRPAVITGVRARMRGVPVLYEGFFVDEEGMFEQKIYLTATESEILPLNAELKGKKEWFSAYCGAAMESELAREQGKTGEEEWKKRDEGGIISSGMGTAMDDFRTIRREKVRAEDAWELSDPAEFDTVVIKHAFEGR